MNALASAGASSTNSWGSGGTPGGSRPSIRQTLDRARTAGTLLEIVTGAVPGWDDPWARARRVAVLGLDAWTVRLRAGTTEVHLSRAEIRAIRLVDEPAARLMASPGFATLGGPAWASLGHLGPRVVEVRFRKNLELGAQLGRWAGALAHRVGFVAARAPAGGLKECLAKKSAYLPYHRC